MNVCQLCKTAPAEILCSRCLRRVERAIEDLPGLVEDLELTVTRQTAGAALARRAGGETALPFDDSERVQRARRDVTVLDEWADLIAGSRARAASLTMAGRARRSARALLDRLAWFEVDEQAPDAALAMVQIRDSLRRAVDRPASRVFAGLCGAEIVALVLDVDQVADVITPAIEVSTCAGEVYAEPGDPLAICAACGGGHHVAERRQLTLAAIEDELLPLAEILAAVPVLTGRNPDRATVRQWRARRRLVPASTTPAGVDLYRGGDVLRLVVDEGTRPGPRRTDEPAVVA